MNPRQGARRHGWSTTQREHLRPSAVRLRIFRRFLPAGSVANSPREALLGKPLRGAAMSRESFVLDLEFALGTLPVFDVHTHLVGGRLGARGLHDVLLYHMVVSDLYAAGCPSGARLTQFPGWPDEQEAHERLSEAVPYLPLIRNTSSFWGVRLILRDLYDWEEPITTGNW